MGAPHKAIVTGATGVVGRHLALHLRDRGDFAVIGLSRRTPDIEAAGGAFRWENLWPALAACFGMEPGPPRHIRLTEMMADKSALWDRMVKKHRLRPYRYEGIVNWAYGDFVFTSEFDVLSDMTKARHYGFCDAVDTERMFHRIFDRLRKDRVIP